MKEDCISYYRIAKAQLYYASLGYINIETPWFVSLDAISVTLPSERRPILSALGALVGSAEQGFIQMMLDGTLKPGKYQSTGPCFRDEPNYDDMHRPAFMKTELIWYKPERAEESLQVVLNNALSCFRDIFGHYDVATVYTEEGIDLNINGIEIGSYGIRRMQDHSWIYGTGIAEPRFSLAIRNPCAVQ